MRSVKEAENFPYGMSKVCYFEVDKNGDASQVYHKNKSEIRKQLNKII